MNDGYTGKRRGTHPRKSFDPVQNFFVQTTELLGRVSRGLGQELRKQQFMVFETQIPALQISQGPQKKARAHEEHERKRYLNGHEEFRDKAAGSSTRHLRRCGRSAQAPGVCARHAQQDRFRREDRSAGLHPT